MKMTKFAMKTSRTGEADADKPIRGMTQGRPYWMPYYCQANASDKQWLSPVSLVVDITVFDPK